ncbi:MAG TPA: helix-turn-helix domain-containing protein [Thermoleophilia bacterium]|nr:helix-turn-helix domain-containing protein [Thermoleophilia bacterium]
MDEAADRQDVAALQAEIVRLNKVVGALMDRSEASMNALESDFGLFQTTVMLQDQVRRHTEGLEAALRERDAEPSGAAASVARDMQTLRRTAALQIQLLELVVQEKDVGELVDRVATILDVPIVLFDAHGQVVHASGSSADDARVVRRFWEAYERLRGLPGPHAVVEQEDDRIYFREVLIMDRVERVLAAVVSRRQPSDFAAVSLLYLQQLVTLELLRKRDELRMRRRLRRGLLRDVLAARGAAQDLRIRLQEQGFSAASVLRVAVVEPAALGPESRAPAGKTADKYSAGVLRALDAWLSQRRIPFLSLSNGPTVVVLTSLPDAETATARELLDDLRATASAATAGPVVTGCSAPLGDVDSAPRCLQQARAACMAARRSPEAGGTAIFDELSGHLILLDGLDQKALSNIVQRTFGPLLDYDTAHRTSLFKTLYSLFEHRLAVQQTADALYIHRNTLQKRIAHVEEILGIDLNELDDVVDIRLGLQAAVLLGRHPD